jgi:hypothetical protein
MFALVARGRISQIEAEAFPVHPDLAWADISTASPAPAVGWTATQSDGAWAFAAPVIPAPTLAQQAAAILAGGLAVTCASVPTLSGTYALDDIAQKNITTIASAIAAGLGLPGGGDTFNYPDVSGTFHPWTAVAFPVFAKAALNLVYAVNMVVAGQSTVLPGATLTIA